LPARLALLVREFARCVQVIAVHRKVFTAATGMGPLAVGR
jgi:hypothetical protein